MENSATGSFAKTAQGLADKAADKAQSSIRIGQDTANTAGGLLSNKLEDVRSEAGTVISRGSKRIQSAKKQGLDAITEMAGQARDVVSNGTDSIVAYTKENPVKALGVAAAIGALLYAVVKALRSARN